MFTCVFLHVCYCLSNNFSSLTCLPGVTSNNNKKGMQDSPFLFKHPTVKTATHESGGTSEVSAFRALSKHTFEHALHYCVESRAAFRRHGRCL